MLVVLALAAVQSVTPAPATVTLPDEPGAVLTIAGDDADDLALVARWGSVTRRMPVRTVDEALALLADARLAPLWPALTARTGADLVPFRDAAVAAARAAAAAGRTRVVQTTAASSVRQPVRAAMALADALWTAGQRDAAVATLVAVRGAAPGKGDWGRAEWTMLSTRLATYRAEAGDVDGALRIVAEAEAPLAGSPYALNFAVNRAAFLAEAGRAAEALAAIDAAEGRFAGTGNGRRFRGGEKVPGSDRHFAWIRACALSRLGRTAEAAQAAASLFPVVEPSDRRFVVDTSVDLRRRHARCTGDVAAGARAYADSLAAGPSGGKALLELQPALHHPRVDPGYMAAVRAHPLLAPVLADRLRILPAALIPALNGWVAPRH